MNRLRYLALILLPVLSGCSGSNSDKDRPAGPQREAQVHAEKFVREHLKFPEDASFSSQTTTEVNEQGDVWVVAGVVTMKNVGGSRSTIHYKAQLFVEDGKWNLVNLLLDGREVSVNRELVEKLWQRKKK